MKKPSAPLMLILALLFSFNVFSLPNLNSLPTAPATIYLDFDGHNVTSAYWNGGHAFTCAASGLDAAQVTEIFHRVAEDFRPFNVNISTDLNKFLAAPLSKRIRIVITPTSNWFTGVGGVSFTGSFKWGDDTPAFVFCDRLGPNSPKMVAECCSHESGHAVGLSHQSKYDGACTLTATYNDGAGAGVNAWAPIMGNSYYRNMTGWNNGPTPYGCASTQDNLSIITTQNGFSFRADDHSDNINLNPSILSLSGTNINGIVSTNTDQDAFEFTVQNTAAINISIKPFSVDANYQGANLDIKLSLFNSYKTLIRTYDPLDAMNVALDTVLSAGAYYLIVDGTGNSNIGDYGSLGSYSIAAAVSGVLPIHDVSLSGKADNGKHNLSWAIVSDEPVKTIAIESSVNGIHFTDVRTIGGTANRFEYTPQPGLDLYYRVKATSALNHSVYSNVIVLKAVASGKAYKVSAFAINQITINAIDKYDYMLMSMNGAMLAKGRGLQGFSSIDVNRLPAGMYVLQLVNNDTRQTERIIKQ